MSKGFSKFLLLMVVLAALYLGFTRYRHQVGSLLPPSIRPGGDVTLIVYDTDPQNDRFIKGNLTGKQFRLLDRILNEEERNGGMRISGGRVRQYAMDDKAVIEAYDRWRRCCSLMRSENYVIYPSQRQRRR